MATSIPSGIKRSMDTVFFRYLETINEYWSKKPLRSVIPFRFASDGLPSDMRTEGTLYAALCLNLKGALDWEWGWGFIEILDTLKNGEFLVEANELDYLAKVFSYLNETFGTTQPQAPSNLIASKSSPLYSLLLRQFARDVHWQFRKNNNIDSRDKLTPELEPEGLAPLIDEHDCLKPILRSLIPVEEYQAMMSDLNDPF